MPCLNDGVQAIQDLVTWRSKVKHCTCLDYIGTKGEHYMPCLHCEGGQVFTIYLVDIERESRHYIPCLHCEEGWALHALLTLLGEGRLYNPSLYDGGKTLHALFTWLGRANAIYALLIWGRKDKCYMWWNGQSFTQFGGEGNCLRNPLHEEGGQALILLFA